MRDQSENACCFLQVLELFSVVSLDTADQCQGVNTETSVSTETVDKISVAWQYYGNEKKYFTFNGSEISVYFEYTKTKLRSNIPNTIDRVSWGYPNTENRVKYDSQLSIFEEIRGG